jgi:hypothetical protein
VNPRSPYVVGLYLKVEPVSPEPATTGGRRYPTVSTVGERGIVIRVPRGRHGISLASSFMCRARGTQNHIITSPSAEALGYHLSSPGAGLWRSLSSSDSASRLRRYCESNRSDVCTLTGRGGSHRVWQSPHPRPQRRRIRVGHPAVFCSRLSPAIRMAERRRRGVRIAQREAKRNAGCALILRR